jgi:hypothetical protein
MSFISTEINAKDHIINLAIYAVDGIGYVEKALKQSRSQLRKSIDYMAEE